MKKYIQLENGSHHQNKQFPKMISNTVLVHKNRMRQLSENKKLEKSIVFLMGIFVLLLLLLIWFWR